jgi:manganese/zinc/iron transport system substrate-binding protein
LGETLPEELLLEEPDLSVPDPHLWMDVSRWMLVVEAIADVFSEYDPANAEVYAANAEAYLEELEELHQQVIEAIASIPEERRILVTAHDAFQYFGDAYEIGVFAPQGITTEAEVGVEDIRATIDLLVTREIPAMFVESSVSPDTVIAVIEGARARGWEVALAEPELFSNAMGTPGTFEGTYIGMIATNTNTIVGALGGDVFVPTPETDEEEED